MANQTGPGPGSGRPRAPRAGQSGHAAANTGHTAALAATHCCPRTLAGVVLALCRQSAQQQTNKCANPRGMLIACCSSCVQSSQESRQYKHQQEQNMSLTVPNQANVITDSYANRPAQQPTASSASFASVLQQASNQPTTSATDNEPVVEQDPGTEKPGH